MPTRPNLLVADIGGTNTRVALSNGRAIVASSIRRYSNAAENGLDSILCHYLAETGNPDCAGACIAVAGPVDGDSARMTNLDWTIEPASVARITGAPFVRIMNDLQAQGHALGQLADDKITTLKPATLPATRTDQPAVRLVIGVGTGFNAAAVHDVGTERIVTASECGHTSLPVSTSEDFELSTFLASRHGFASIEDVLSGRGLEALYHWHSVQEGQNVSAEAAHIMAAIAAGSDATALATARHFLSIFGSVTGDLALTHLASGGVYLIGGVARAFRDHYGSFGFAKSFRDKGRFSDFLDGFPVYLVEDDFAALTGCAAFLSRQLHDPS